MTMPQRIGIDWQLTSFTGWGVFGLNLALTMVRRGGPAPILLRAPGPVSLDPLRHRALAPALAWAEKVAGPRLAQNPGAIGLRIPVLQSVGEFLGSDVSPTPGSPTIGVVFLERTDLTADHLARGRRYPLLLAGSTWLADLLRARGIPQARAALQGIDPSLFHPGPRTRPFGDRFVVFSGGKLELRKGQDLVIEAFRRFHARHRDALLLTAWQNSWPETMKSFETSGRLPSLPRIDRERGLDIDGWLTGLGLPEGSHLDLGFVPNGAVPSVVREADVAVLPSRAEGGTNLVAMECMACGVPTIVSANTGHLDLLAPPAGAIALTRQRAIASPGDATRGWGESDVEEIVAAMEAVRAAPEAARTRALRTAAWMATEWSWDRRVAQLLELTAAAA